MTDYIDQAYRYFTSDDLLESSIFVTIGSFIEGTIVFMYALISVLTIVFLQKILKQTQQYTGIYIIVASSILIFRQLKNHFKAQTDNFGKKQTKKSIQYLLSKDTEAVNLKYQNYNVGMEMCYQMNQNKRKSQSPLLTSPYRIYLQQHAKLEKQRLKNKATAKVFEMLSSFMQFVLLFMLKIFKSNVDVWQFQILVTITLIIKVAYLFGFQIIYRVIIKSYILEGKQVTM